MPVTFSSRKSGELSAALPAFVYASLLFCLICPGSRLWFIEGFPVVEVQFDFLARFLDRRAPESRRLLLATDVLQSLLILFAGSAYCWLVKSMPDNCFDREFRFRSFVLLASLLIIGCIGIPWMSLDMFWPIAKGWAQVHYHIDVYSTPLRAIPQVTTDPMFLNSEHLNTKGNYGPLNQLLSSLIALLGNGHIQLTALIYKIFLAAGLVAATCLVYFIARPEKNAGKLAFIYCSNPLSVIAILAWGHNDIWQNAFVLGSLLALKTRRAALAGLLIAAATALKFVAVLIVPLFALFLLLSNSNRLSSAFTFCATTVLAVACAFLIYPHSFRVAVSGLDMDWSPQISSLSVLLYTIAPLFGFGHAETTRVLSFLYAVTGITLTFVIALPWKDARINLSKLCEIACLIYVSYLVLAAPSVLEWYLTWFLGFALLTQKREYFNFSVILAAFFSVLNAFALHGSLDRIFAFNTVQYMFFASVVVYLLMKRLSNAPLNRPSPLAPNWTP